MATNYYNLSQTLFKEDKVVYRTVPEAHIHRNCGTSANNGSDIKESGDGDSEINMYDMPYGHLPLSKLQMKLESESKTTSKCAGNTETQLNQMPPCDDFGYLIFENPRSSNVSQTTVMKNDCDTEHTEHEYDNNFEGQSKERYNVSVLETKASQRNRLSTASNVYCLCLDKARCSISLQKRKSMIGRGHFQQQDTILFWPFQSIRR